LDDARAKAADDRERRQIQKLSAAVEYWELAADMFRQCAEANRLAKSDPKAAVAILDRVLDQQWPKFEAATQWSRAPGWICITVPSQWQGTRTSVDSLRAKLRASETAASKSND
jgi:hypothetical protein